MRNDKRSWLILLAVGLLAACLGCPKGDTPQGPENSNGAENGAAPGSNAKGTSGKTPAPDPPPKPTIPKVNLTETDRAKCLLWIGDAMEEVQLPDTSGQMHSLGEFYGQELTVVFFWQSGDTMFTQMAAEDALESLAKDFAEPMAEQGVRVIGVNVGDSPPVVLERIAKAQAEFPQLLDAGGAYFLANVATEKWFGTYLLDAQGKVLWLDTEFSEITRKDLRQGIEVVLDKK